MVQHMSAMPGVKTVEEQPVRSAVNAASVVLIVGASRGIGLEFVAQCAQKGGKVYGTYRGSAVPAGLAALAKAHADKVVPVSMEVTDSASIKKAVGAMPDAADITHVVHNAGIGTFDSLNKVTEDIMMKTFRVNTVGVVLVAQVLAGVLKKHPVYGVLSSKAGSIDDNGSGGMYAYRASKAAANMVVKSLAVDLGHAISFVILHPGYVRTDMTGGGGNIDCDESVAGMMKAMEATDKTIGLRFVDYKAELIPW